MKKCDWCIGNELYEQYHDTEWGVPVHDDRLLFEMLTLEGAQAGLSWLTVLKKREHYKKVFSNFDLHVVALYDNNKYEQLLLDPGIIRNKLKIRSTITNAQKMLEIQDKYGSFDTYLWQFVDNKPIINNWSNVCQVPPKSPISDKISKELKKFGFSFVGSTIIYAFMQAVGMVNDHITECFRYKELIYHQ